MIIILLNQKTQNKMIQIEHKIKKIKIVNKLIIH